MIDDETHPEMTRAHGDLVARLQLITAGRHPSRTLFDDVMKTRDDHRVTWRLRGVDFPHLVIFVVPRLRIMELWRADLGLESIRVKLLNVVLAFPTVTPRELSLALTGAYPDFRNRALTDEGEKMSSRLRQRGQLGIGVSSP